MGAAMGMVASAALGAAGDLGGSAMGAAGPPPKARVFASSLDTNPALQAVQFETLLSFGIVDPGSLISASPVAMAIAQMEASGIRAVDTKEEILGAFDSASRTARAQIAAGQPISLQHLDNFDLIRETILSTSGMTNVNDFSQSQLDYEAQIGPIIENAYKAAAGNLQARRDVQVRLNELSASMPNASAAGIEQLKASEKARLLREVNRSADEGRSSILARANAGRFNPGDALAQLEESRFDATQDADLDALGRALALISGQQTVAGNEMGLLQQFLKPSTDTALQIANIDLGAPTGSSSFVPSQTGSLGSGVAQAGHTLQSGVNSAINYQQTQDLINRLNKPAVDAQVGSELDAMLNEPGMF